MLEFKPTATGLQLVWTALTSRPRLHPRSILFFVSKSGLRVSKGAELVRYNTTAAPSDDISCYLGRRVGSDTCSQHNGRSYSIASQARVDHVRVPRSRAPRVLVYLIAI